MFSIDKMLPFLLTMNLPRIFTIYSGLSVCNLTKGRTLQPVFLGEIFENGWLRTAASEQSEITACDVIQFLTIKIYFGIPL